MKSDLHDMIDELRKEVRQTYVTIDRFTPIEKVVSGLVAIVLATVIGAIIALVVRL